MQSDQDKTRRKPEPAAESTAAQVGDTNAEIERADAAGRGRRPADDAASSRGDKPGAPAGGRSAMPDGSGPELMEKTGQGQGQSRGRPQTQPQE